MVLTKPVMHDGDVEARRPEEETPLLGHGLPTSVGPSKGNRTNIIGLAMAYIILIEIGSYLQIPPSFQLLEDIICRKYFPDHILPGGGDDVCKTPEVQGELAMIKGWQASFDCVAPLLTSIPYGVIADKYGRRPVLSLAMLGVTLELLWQIQPLLFPEVLPPWTIWIGSAFQLIGGGVGMVNAMIWTMISDVVPSPNLVGATAVVGELVVVPLSAALLTKNPWLPLTLGMIFLIIGTCIPPFIPETLELRRTADQEAERPLRRTEDGTDDKRTLWEQITSSVKNDTGHVYNFLIESRRVSILLLSFNLTVVVKYTKMEIMSQYVHNIFNWSWAKVMSKSPGSRRSLARH
ncbi:ATP synthase F0 [Colletotrichum tofieldiae]|nr:ATP synthase F0 [Colletotrichum tofieldiae]GKT71395.1 ATP synthase F0 [Colletotrichum tofieldiae]